jgi:RNA polymerase-binding protein DksA
MQVLAFMHTRLIRQRLLRHRNTLLARYRSELERADELGAHEIEVVEEATDKWDAQVLAKLGETDARLLADVVAALRRLEAGTYGTCNSCHEAIGEDRLEVLPTATTCIECADEDRPTRRVRLRRSAEAPDA